MTRPSRPKARDALPAPTEASREEFVRSPVGRYVAAETWISLCPSPSLVVSVIWGKLEEPHFDSYTGVVPEANCPTLPPHDHLMHARYVESMDARLVASVAQYVIANHAKFERNVQRLAVVRPAAFVAATVVEGFFAVVPAPFPVRVFERQEDALAWLGATDAAPILTTLIASARAAARPLLAARLREILERDGPGTAIGAVARQLALSPRTLQRRLHLEGTTYRREVNAARIRAAKRLLTESDATIAEIAFRVGYATPAHLSEQFKRQLGESPSAFREKHSTR